MLSKNKVKYIHSLRLKKNRTKLNKYIIEGEKMVHEYLSLNPQAELELWALDNWHSNALNNRPVNEVTTSELGLISSLTTPNKVMAIVDLPTYSPLDLTNGWYLYLYDIQDPGNMGTLLRSASWFGLDGVIVSPHCVDIFNTKVVQASMSALLNVRINVLDFDNLLEIKNLNIHGTTMEGTSLYTYDFPTNGILVLGNEGQGIPPESLAKCTHKLAIPSSSSALTESLNVAIAGSVLMSYIRR